jgi:hypothetical protein
MPFQPIHCTVELNWDKEKFEIEYVLQQQTEQLLPLPSIAQLLIPGLLC